MKKYIKPAIENFELVGAENCLAAASPVVYVGFDDEDSTADHFDAKETGWFDDKDKSQGGEHNSLWED